MLSLDLRSRTTRDTHTRCMGCVFDDNSQNNIMSDIDKHHGDSYSCDVQEQQSQLSQKLVAAAIAQWVKNGKIARKIICV